jgi:integrase
MKKAKIKDLPSGVGVYRVNNGRTEFWRVRLGKRFTGGSIITRHFSSLDEARKWVFGDAQEKKCERASLVELRQTVGTSVFHLSPRELGEAVTAFKDCKSAGMTLTEAVRFAIRHAKPAGGTISVTEAIDLALREKAKGKRPSYVADLRKRWKRFERWLPADRRRAINSVTQVDVRRFLDSCNLSPTAERNQLRNLSVLFTWTVSKHHMAENPCRGIKVESAKERRPTRILRVSELRKLLAFAKDGFKIEAAEEERAVWRKKFGSVSILVPPLDMVPVITVGCFAGVRPDESARLEWEMIDFGRKHIDLPAAITKDGERRIVDMSDNLIEWLFLCRRPSGKILPENFRRKRWALCYAMNWKNGWPEDVLRHSYGSYHLARFRNAALTADQMGHKNARMLYTHYREVVKDSDDITDYWATAPSGGAAVASFAA